MFGAAAYFARTHRFIQYFDGAPKNSLYCLASLSSVGAVGSSLLFSGDSSHLWRRIATLASFALSALGTYYAFKKSVPQKILLHFVAAEATIMLALEIITSNSVQSYVVETRRSFFKNLTLNHFTRTFGAAALFGGAAYFAGTKRYIHHFPNTPNNSLYCLAALSSAGAIASGVLFSGETSHLRRRISILASFVLSALGTYYGFKKRVPFKTMLHFVAAEAIIMVALEVITSENLQSHIVETTKSFSKNLTLNHFIRTFGTPALFGAAAYFAGRQRFIRCFPGATRNSLLCTAGLSSVGLVGSGVVFSDEASHLSRRVAILASLALSALGTYYGLKKTIPLKPILYFIAAQALIMVAIEVITSESLQNPIARARESFLKNRSRTHTARMLIPPTLFVIAALFANIERIRPYFPGATRNSLLCAAGLGGIGVIGSGLALSTQEEDSLRRIWIAVGVVFSALVTYYGFKKTPTLQASFRFAAIQAIISFATEVLTVGGPKFPKARLKSSLDQAILSIIVPEETPPPPNVAMTFCIDTSGSMTSENRERDVKEGIQGVLDSAAQIADRINAKIRIAVVGFSSKATTICEPMKVTKDSVKKIKQVVDKYQSSGTTALYEGLMLAADKVERMRSDASTHTMIVLTDGDVDISGKKVGAIHRRLAAANAQLFAVGIGDSHNKSTLQKLAPVVGTFRGTYIDTTQGQSIAQAISAIYEQTIAVYSQLELRTFALKGGEWSVSGKESEQKEGYSVCTLENRSEDKQEDVTIKIHSDQLTSPFDLSRLSFQLIFRDPNGKEGVIDVPWDANTVIDPQVLAAR